MSCTSTRPKAMSRPAKSNRAKAYPASVQSTSCAARIIVTSRNFTRDLGIQWGFLNQKTAQFGNTTNLSFPHSIIINGQGAPTGQGISASQGGLTPNAGIGTPANRGYAVNLPAQGHTSGIGVSLGNILGSFNIDAAITAAETGHLVFGTLHTTGAAKTIDRVVNAFPSNQQEQIRIQLSTVLQAVISQLLIPRIDKPGRVAIFEIMVNTPSIAALIRDNKTFRVQSDIQTGAKYGMVTLDSFLIDKYLQGMIAREEVVTKAQDPVTIQAKLQELELAAAVGAETEAVVQGKV